LECGGKRSATPPWILLRKRKSGVALRLPPHSKEIANLIQAKFLTREVVIAKLCHSFFDADLLTFG